jgi:malate synthase
VLPGTGITAAAFWAGFDAIVRDLAPRNAALLAERDRLQAEIDAWHRAHPGPITDMPAYRAFLQRIGYLQPQCRHRCRRAPPTWTPNWRCRPGRSWWCRILNARYALNAANARWGSLYDALYGTDALPETGGAERGNPTTRCAAPRSSPTRVACSTRPRR